MENNTVYYIEEQWALYTMRVPCCPHCRKRIDATAMMQPAMHPKKCPSCHDDIEWEDTNEHI